MVKMLAHVDTDKQLKHTDLASSTSWGWERNIKFKKNTHTVWRHFVLLRGTNMPKLRTASFSICAQNGCGLIAPVLCTYTETKSRVYRDVTAITAGQYKAEMVIHESECVKLATSATARNMQHAGVICSTCCWGAIDTEKCSEIGRSHG